MNTHFLNRMIGRTPLLLLALLLFGDPLFTLAKLLLLYGQNGNKPTEKIYFSSLSKEDFCLLVVFIQFLISVISLLMSSKSEVVLLALIGSTA